ncbi:MAG: hypothetical protein E3J35_06895 [Methanomassiliicoccales archaeon]|nr:MAG: hypothetical protein E3J35_06895 [Methanomassiliicoccales archaeon]
MTRTVELKKSIYEKLQQICELEDEVVTTFVNDLLEEWLEENFKAILEGEADSDEEDGENEFEQEEEDGTDYED